MPMNKAKKAVELQEVQNVLAGDIGAVVAVENKGLTVKEFEAMRRGANDEGTICKVSKNSLSKLAFAGTKFAGMVDLFKGPTTLLMSKDMLSAARVAHKFSGDKLVILGGSDGQKVLDKKEIVYYASLPSLDALRGKLVGLLQAPAAQLARVVNAYATKEAA